MKKMILGLGFICLAICYGEAKTYTAIPGESRITYFLKHPMHKIEGVAKEFACKVELSDDTLKSLIQVKIPVTAFNSGNSNRDSHTLEVLEAFKYPTVEFSSDSIQRSGSGYHVFGQLLFHGVKHLVDFTVTPTIGMGKIHIAGGFAVSLTDFKVQRPSLLFVPVEDGLRIDLDLVASGP